jgi:hypothetical protein
VATLTVNPAMLALLGLTVRDLRTPVLTQNAISALEAPIFLAGALLIGPSVNQGGPTRTAFQEVDW